MPINAVLERYHEQRLDTLTLGKISDCCPSLFAAGGEGLLKFNRLSKLIAHWMSALCSHSIIYFANASKYICV